MDHEALERMLLDANAEPTDLPISLLKSITNDFSDDQNIGSGGFADVYKGVLPNGTAVAVKRLSPQVDMDEKSFNREVISLIRVKHNNIVRFLGYCGDTQMKVQNYMGKVVMADVRQRVLCFEFMPNGSLDKYINDASKGLDWRTRYQIIKGICRGLQYLHQQNIVHLDLKPANILLGHNMVPKIADFGLSKCFDETQTRAITMNLSGSLGYMAPELLLDGVTSIKSDIYSLGIIIMQILTGKKRCPEIENVLENWRARFESSKRETWLEHVRLCAEIGTECTDFNPVKRPTARHIIERLDEIDHRYGFIETDLCTSSVTHEPQSAPRATKEYGNGDQKSRKSCFERQHENVDALIDCVGKNLGYCVGKPVAAFTICKCLLHWKSFEAEKTPVFDRLIQLIGSAIENEDDKNLAYWLSNTSSLLFILQRCFKASGAPGSVRNKAPQPTSLFARMAQGLYVPPHLPGIHVEAIGVVQKVEARYPALLFKQQLTAYLDKIYGIIRDNIKKEIASLLSLCIHAPRTMKASMLRVSGRSAGQSQSQSNHWEKIIKSLDSLLMILKENYVPPVLSQKTFSQVFLCINVQLFNSLLLRRECCSFSNGEYVKAGLAELELWCAKATTEYAASSWDELKHIRQTVGFLCIFQKHRISYDQIVNDLCPILSVQQLYRICTQYWDDKYNTQSVSSDVLTHMRVVMTEDSNSAGSFLLDDDDSRIIPFSVDDITNSIQEGGFGDVKPAEELLQNPAFEFLQDYQVFT